MPGPYDVLGLVCGILGLILPLAGSYLHSQRPHRKMQQLDTVMEETKKLLDSAVKAGYVPDSDFAPSMEKHLLPYVLYPNPSPHADATA